MEKDEGIKKYFLKNNYNLVFSILAFIAMLFFIASVSKIDLKIGILTQTVGLFSSSMWFLLLLSLVISSALSYFEKYKWIALPVFIWLLIFTAQFRTANISQLIDITTGNYTLGPDLDPFLYLRLAEDINQGIVPSVDCMRYAPICSNNYAKQSLMPWVIVGFYKIISLFKEATLTYAAIITPVILFLISLIGFFLFVKTIFSFKTDKIKSSVIALIASFFYAVSPAMLHRTTGGIPEIESLGMAFFWFAMLFFSLAWKSEKKNKWIIFGIIAALFTELMSFSWGGYRYLYLIFSLTAFVIFFLEKDIKKNIIIFSSWFIPAVIIEIIKSKGIQGVIMSISGTGAAVIIFLLLFLQAIFIKFKLGNRFKKINIPNNLKILILAIILGIVGLLVINPKLLIDLPSTIIRGLLSPFGSARVSLTVAENSSPYFPAVISQFGYILWAFLISTVILFYESVKHFEKKDKVKLISSFIIFISCISFTRISSTSMLNGENAISKFIFFAGFIIFALTILNVYVKSYKKGEDLEVFKKIDFSYILLLTFSFWAIISMRGAVRLFFIVSPMIILVASVLPVRLYEIRKRSRDDLLKLIIIILLVIVTLIFLYTFIQYTSSVVYEAKSTVPGIYEQQWQNAMSWVRENTAIGSIFVHWWDYGYWVQTIGERPTVTDGGHFTAYWDHLIGRYLLTTPSPETALSFMKAHNVSYLLIDSTDLGKYTAYSSIGNDESGGDRYSWLPIMQSSPSQIQETQNGTIKIYSGGFGLDEDIIYEKDGKENLLSKSKTGLGGVVLEYVGNSINQPEGVFIQNGNQIRLPLRYAYYNKNLYDFKEGIEATVMILPSMTNDATSGVKIDYTGAMIYLSNKTRNGLFAQLYLMDDSLKQYPTVKISHVEQDVIIDYLNAQGANLEFVYYGGFRGPIKIWEVNYPENIIAKEEFLRMSGKYAEFDNLTFVK
ncbi:MAG: STT3 domain-containing protein [Candidatus Diapherotrites archaeon]